jgi:NTP pyrophosphatase (non-canonical NTP hydrolase)
VVAVTSTFASSLRSAVQAVAAIAAGATIAATTQVLGIPQVAALAAVVGIGTLVGSWPRLGEMASWVPISALFVLIVGGDDPAYYVAAYLGLTAIGAAAGVVVNGAFPPLPLTANSLTLRRLRSVLADQLDDLADGLLQSELPHSGEWQARRWHLAPHVAEMHRLAQQVTEARRANWRERRWRDAADRQRQHAMTLGRLAGLVEELVELVVDREAADAHEVALGPSLRPVTAGGLEAMAAVLRARPEDEAWQDAFATLTHSIEELRAATRVAWRDHREDRFTASAIVVDLERAAHSLQQTAESLQRTTGTGPGNQSSSD